jgi:hypothetical protein
VIIIYDEVVMTKETVHGHADTLEEAVGLRTHGWTLPAKVVRHKDGNLPLRAVYAWDEHKNRHVLSIACWVFKPERPLTDVFTTAKTPVKAVKEKRSILTWTLPGDLTGAEVVAAFMGVADVLAMHNGMPCFIVAPHSKLFNRLRKGTLPYRKGTVPRSGP